MTSDLANFAQAEFALEVRQKDGCSLRDHLESAWKQSGEKPQELIDAPPLPESGRYLWEYYLELHHRRVNYGWGHIPLGYGEILAWRTLTRRRLDPWELSALLEIDGAYLASIAKPAEGS